MYNMKINFTFFLILIIPFLSCTKKLSLQEELSCSVSSLFADTFERKDMHKNFKIDIPKTWKHQLYYDDYQSSVIMADTIKELTETFILDAAWKNGDLQLNDSFEKSILNANSYPIIKSNKEQFRELPCYWYISKGTKNDFTYHIFNLFIKTSEENYLEFKAEIYGEELVDERLCEAIAVINSVEIIE